MKTRGSKETGRASMRGRVVVISGPSGSGKTTVCRRLLSEPGSVLSVSATTRPPRRGEKEGVDYYFVSREKFMRRVEEGEFAEHAEYNGQFYGTPRAPLEAALARGQTVLLEIDVQGAAQVRRLYPDALHIFLDAPDRAAAMARLERRNTETAEERRRRGEAAERERASAARVGFDYTVINDDLDATVARIRELIRGGRPSPAGAASARGGRSAGASY